MRPGPIQPPLRQPGAVDLQSDPDPIISRLHRYADHLPISEPIAIVQDEILAIAEWEDSQYSIPNPQRVPAIITTILDGKGLFRGHRLIVLK